MSPLQRYFFMASVAVVALGLMQNPPEEKDLLEKRPIVKRFLDAAEKACGPQELDIAYIPDPGMSKIERLVTLKSKKAYFGGWRMQLIGLLWGASDEKLALLEKYNVVVCLDPELQKSSIGFFGYLNREGVLWQTKSRTYLSLPYHPLQNLVSPVISAAADGLARGQFEVGEIYEGHVEGDTTRHGIWTKLERPILTQNGTPLAAPNLR